MSERIGQAERTRAWLRAVEQELGTNDERAAWSALRAGLHALRDHLPEDEAARLGVRLPLTVRRLYFEGWVRSPTPQARTTLRSEEEWIAELRGELDRSADARGVTRVVFRLLDEHIAQRRSIRRAPALRLAGLR